eukprot:TRINITY_DN2327_c1_g1_i1.p1 TRINITY_DN2327_c1_g1~~TRINITY_DN2327_c1_g1_i1.p1  ORF type:complete len:215 (-),score=-16.74 TRINITY_DN2327_c1_g1_i1:315-959(-)
MKMRMKIVCDLKYELFSKKKAVNLMPCPPNIGHLYVVIKSSSSSPFVLLKKQNKKTLYMKGGFYHRYYQLLSEHSTTIYGQNCQTWISMQLRYESILIHIHILRLPHLVNLYKMMHIVLYIIEIYFRQVFVPKRVFQVCQRSRCELLKSLQNRRLYYQHEDASFKLSIYKLCIRPKLILISKSVCLHLSVFNYKRLPSHVPKLMSTLLLKKIGT